MFSQASWEPFNFWQFESLQGSGETSQVCSFCVVSSTSRVTRPDPLCIASETWMNRFPLFWAPLGHFFWNSSLIWSELKFGTFARMFVACFFGLTQGLEERVWTEVELLALLSSRHLNKDTLSRAAPCPSMSSFCFNTLSWWGMKAASQPPILAKLILDVVLAPQQQVPEFGASRPI